MFKASVIVTQYDLISKPDLATKPRQTLGNLQFSKSQMSFLSLGTKVKVPIL